MRKNTQLIMALCSLIWIATLSESICQNKPPLYRWELGVNAYTHLYSAYPEGPYDEDHLWLPGVYIKYHFPYQLSLEGYYYQFHQPIIESDIIKSYSQMNHHSAGWTLERTNYVKSYWGYHYGLASMYTRQNQDSRSTSDPPYSNYDENIKIQVLRIMPIAGINALINHRISIKYQVQFILFSYNNRFFSSHQSSYTASNWLNGFMGDGTLSVGYRFGM